MASPKLRAVRALFHTAQRAADVYWEGRDLDSRIIREQAITGASPIDIRIFDTFFVDRIRVLLSQSEQPPPDTGPKAVRIAIEFGKII